MTSPVAVEWRPGRLTLARVLPPLGVVAALVLLYAPVVEGLITVWMHVPYFSYGLLVPFWSAWTALGARSRVLAAPRRRDLVGLPIVAVGLVALAVAAAHKNLTLATLSLPVVLTGLGRFALGREAFRPLAFPVAFLALMAPLPPGVLPPLSLRLQELAVGFSAMVLEALRVPFVREGLLLHLSSVTVFVSESCNGLRFLLAMVVLGVAFAWAVERALRYRLLVFAVALGAGIGANLVRVSSAAALVHYFDPDAVARHHNLTGKAIYLVVVALVFLLTLRLKKRA